MNHHLSIAAILSALLLAACSREEPEPAPTATSMSATPSPAPTTDAVEDLSCSGPIPASTTLAALRQKFGDDASVETMPGPEGTEYEAVVLWEDDPARRIEVVFGEGDGAKVSSLSIGKGSSRAIAGLRIGDTPAQAQALNGRPFGFYGFSWDYGGNTTGWRGGKLDTLPGGCTVSGRFDPRADDLATALMGDQELSSDVAGLDKADAHFDELRLINPE